MRKSVFLVLILAQGLTSLFAADPSMPSSATVWQRQFIDALVRNADYYRAVTETYRLYYFYPGGGPSLPMEFSLARIYMLGHNYSLARNNWFLCLTNKSLLPDARSEIRWGLARSYEMEDDWNNAMIQYGECPENSPEKEMKKLEMNIRMFKFDEAGSLLSGFNSRSLSSEEALRLSLLKKKYAEARKLPYRSETAANFLSVIPGMNLFYLGRFKDGLIRLTVQAGGGILTWYSFKQKDYVSGILLSVTLLSWYIYNFTMNAGEVEEFNRALERKFQESFNR
jgi:hypothetical protein